MGFKKSKSELVIMIGIKNVKIFHIENIRNIKGIILNCDNMF